MDARTRRFTRVAAVRQVMASRAQLEVATRRAAEAKGGQTVARLHALAADYQPTPGVADAAALARLRAFGATFAGAARQAAVAQHALTEQRERAEASALEAERQRHLAERLRDAARDRHGRAAMKAERSAQSGTRPATDGLGAAIR